MENQNDVDDLGVLVSERVTLTGFAFALLDIAIMAVDLVATIYGMKVFASRGDLSLEAISILAVSLFFLSRWVSDWLRVCHPKGNYEYERVFRKEGKTTVMTGRHLFDSE